MTDTVDLSKIRYEFKRQSVVGTAVSGTGGFGMECLSGQGLQAAAAKIVSAMIKRNKMKRRARRGAVKTTASYQTELQPGVFEELALGVLGAEDWTPEATFDNTDFGAVVIADDGTDATMTFASGNLYDAGWYAGLFVWFRNLSVPGNNDHWVPIVNLSGTNGRIVKIPTGYMAANLSDAAYEVTLCRYAATPAEYDDKVYTQSEYLGDDIDRAKKLKDTRFNSLILNESPTEFPKVGWGVAGRRMEMTNSGPVFTDAEYPEGTSLILLDGGLFINGTKRLDITAMTLGITAPVSATDVIGTLDGPSSKIGEFDFDGSISGVIESGDAFDDFDDDADVSIQLHYKDHDSERGIGWYAGNLCYGGYGSPVGGEGDAVQQLPLYGGDDDRGAGYLRSVFVICDLSAVAQTLAS